jgi:putative transposase
MPARNTTKQYLEGGYYHIYNRGVEKRLIFLDHQDFLVFLSYLKEYLLPKDEKKLRQKLLDIQTPYKERRKILQLLRLNNFSDEITLIAFCLMPNHFHLFLKQKNKNSIDSFLQSLCTRYSMYFNRKYKRVGSLYQGVYKGALQTSEEQFLYLSKYIHKQALTIKDNRIVEKHPSSYMYYVGKRKTKWIKPNDVLAFFSKTNPLLSYEAFIKVCDDQVLLSQVAIEDD